ncbi:MAG: uL14 family ribosomal protein, partial [Chloroflexi bacterium]|nr:uL14 family ribosomal protein [Chloroflexota bacterium]
KKERRRQDGSYIKFDENAVVLINEAREWCGDKDSEKYPGAWPRAARPRRCPTGRPPRPPR